MLRENENRVQVVIMENVPGINAKGNPQELEHKAKKVRMAKSAGSKKSKSSDVALDVIMRGVLTGDRGEDILVGFELIPHYSWKVFSVQASVFGLPHKRRRLYIVGIHMHIGGEAELDRISKAIDTWNDMPKNSNHITEFMLREDIAKKYAEEGWGETLTRPQPMTAKGFKTCDAFRSKMAFPARDDDHGKSYSKKHLSHSQRNQLGERRCELLDFGLPVRIPEVRGPQGEHHRGPQPEPRPRDVALRRRHRDPRDPFRALLHDPEASLGGPGVVSGDGVA